MKNVIMILIELLILTLGVLAGWRLAEIYVDDSGMIITLIMAFVIVMIISMYRVIKDTIHQQNMCDKS